ncbi:hypothetical protein AALO_G00286530 [Alosa alosa]|uniref:Uncharacterized protein n=2 Tax=Alosa alosa TaxID=278164 RepID=A0AAV6FKC8_9TELE|nr:otospiralin-like isoform X3 [Alosa alosa]KAG5261627.1 hypothetical protein AALO_G00286530 [Alosa alosa]
MPRLGLLLCTFLLGYLWMAEVKCSEDSGVRETHRMPNWALTSSDFFGWVEELRSHAGYDKIEDLARTFWAHFPSASRLGYDPPPRSRTTTPPPPPIPGSASLRSLQLGPQKDVQGWFILYTSNADAVDNAKLKCLIGQHIMQRKNLVPKRYILHFIIKYCFLSNFSRIVIGLLLFD